MKARSRDTRIRSCSFALEGAPSGRPNAFSSATIMSMPIEFATAEEAAEEFRQGRQIVLVDDEDRENEGDLALPAEKVTPAAINFMAKHARGLVCVGLRAAR